MAVTMRIVAALLVIAAVWGGKYVVSLIFRAAGVRAGGDTGLLRGGLWIGYLERLGIVIAILTSYPAGIAVILGVKTLAPLRRAEVATDSGIGRGASQQGVERSYRAIHHRNDGIGSMVGTAHGDS